MKNYFIKNRLEIIVITMALNLFFLMAINRFDSLGEIGSSKFIGSIMYFAIVAISFAVSLHVYLFRKFIANKE